MIILFISDIHLNAKNHKITNGFLRFLNNEALIANALYIAGDLFDSWIGDDDPNPFYFETAYAIRTLVELGVSCYFIHGNRDFLIGKRFALESGMILLPDEQIINFQGHKILIMHGDTLCTNDKKYQIFRKQIHTYWMQKVFLSMPLFIRNCIARKIRTTSESSNFYKSSHIMDVNLKMVIKIMEKYQVQWLIHGHTHRPNIHRLTVNGKPAFRFVLGSWHNIGSMIKITLDSIELIYFPL